MWYVHIFYTHICAFIEINNYETTQRYRTSLPFRDCIYDYKHIYVREVWYTTENSKKTCIVITTTLQTF